jgi:hypothetical protein
MTHKRYSAQQIIPMLRQAEIGLAAGKTTGEVARQLGISDADLLPVAEVL